MQLEFEVKNQTVKLLGDYELVKGSKNYLVAHFTFSEDWQDVSKKMIYFTKNSPDKEIFVGTTADGDTKIGYTLDSNDSVLVPPEFIQKGGFIVNLTGVNEAEQEVITTNPVTVYVTDNGLLTDETEGKTLPEYLEEKLQDINKAVTDTTEEAAAAADSAKAAQAAQKAAEAAQTAAEKAEDNAEASKKAAAGSATAAAGSANDASGYANTASQHKQGAETAENNAEAAALLAQKWAESGESPDGEPDSKSAKSWATAAATSATAAAQSAGTASTKANEAATSADNAATSAGNAAGSATTAGQHASTANTKAGAAAGSATLAQKWAESDESPDGTAGKKSAKTWAEEAAESASAAMSSKNAAANSATQAAQSAENAGNAAEEAVGNPVMSVGISGKTITVTKKDSTTDTFDVPAPDAATETEATTGTDNTKMMTPLRVAQATAALIASVTESNGTVTVKTKGGTSNTFIIIKTINGKAPTNGNFDIKGIPLDSNGTISPWQHNGIFRGKNLGSSVTAAQWAAIQAGTFDDLYIGDYWTINGVEWVIVAFDYYYNTGDTACTTHHVVVIPRTALYNAQMNETNVVTGGYVGSKMYTTNLNQAKTTIQNAFGSAHILTIRQLFTTATNAEYGFATAFEWSDASVWLMNEVNVYGCYVHTDMYHVTNAWTASKYSIDNRQYPYFAFCLPTEKRQTYWLRDVALPTSFAFVSGDGSSGTYSASNSYGVRPAFCIK